MNWYNEKAIKRIMISWLHKEGFTKQIPKDDKIHGVDIQRRNEKRCRYWFIEVKGAPSPKYEKGNHIGDAKKKQSMGSQRYHWFLTAIGQISLRMNQENGNYGIALPYTEYNKKKSFEVTLFRKRSKVNFFLIDKKGVIFQLTPNSGRYKKV